MKDFILRLCLRAYPSVIREAVGSGSIAGRPNAVWVVCAGVAFSALSGLVPRLLPTTAGIVPPWPDWLGGAFIWVPLLLAAVKVVIAFVRKDLIAETAAALEVAASSLPIVWVLPALVPFRVIPSSWFSSSFWFLCYVPPVLAVCFVMWLLLHRRRARVAL